MKQFRKRTLALVLASVVTVVGAFGADNYKNSLMSLKIDSGSDNAVNITLFTKQNYSQPITTYKKDANTYTIMLSETDGRNAKIPELTGNVKSININTMPYTTNGQGYTKITIQTNTEAALTAQKALYIETNNTNVQPKINTVTPINTEPPQPNKTFATIPTSINTPKNENITPQKININESVKNFEPTNTEKVVKNTQTTLPKQKETSLQNNKIDTEDSFDYTLILMGVLSVLFVCILIVIQAKKKMTEVVGEHSKFSFEDEKPSEKKEKKSRIKNTINKLDKMYERPLKMPIDTSPSGINGDYEENNQQSNMEETVVVDLDELFNDKFSQENEEDTNDALEDFLNAFNSDSTTNENDIHEEENKIINELFEKYIQNGTYMFSSDDIEKLNKLLNCEISDDTFKNIEKYAISNPIKPKKISTAEKLENFITSYTINQNISFGKDDVDALNKLINVEIDNDFLTDLTTNPERTAQMQKEIESREISHKKREMLTLNVKDMLPNLSEELKKQGNKRIESEVKPEVVYFSEGYEVNKLSVKDELPNLVLDFDNPEFTKYRPSDEVEVAESGYDVQVLSVGSDLPNLEDALLNPDKYENKKQKVKADEKALLNNISNVTFKPFYDGKEDFEIINKFTDLNDEEKEEDKTFEEIYENESEKVIEKEVEKEIVVEQKEQPTLDNSEKLLKILEKEDDKKDKRKTRVYKDRETIELLELIKSQRNERKLRAERIKKEHEEKRKLNNSLEKKSVIANNKKEFCTIDGEKFEILSSYYIDVDFGCHLAKNERGYTVLGFNKNNIIKLKSYETLKSNIIQLRINDELSDGTVQYIVRIGLNKFILNIKGNKMEYIMDLC